jgi:hypothetical protein
MRAATKREVVQWTFDRGTGFLNKDVRSHARDELRASTFYSNVEHPWENGLAGRSFGVMFTIARALLHDAQCHNNLWGHAILYACYSRNRRPSKKCGGKSPAHYATGAPTDLSKLRVFGCPAMVHVRERQRPDPKLDHRSVLTMFVGVSTVGNGWIFLQSRDRQFYDVKHIDSIDVKFNELFEDMKMPLNKTSENGNVFEPSLSDSTITEKQFHPFSDAGGTSASPLPAPISTNFDDVSDFMDALSIGVTDQAPPSTLPSATSGRGGWQFFSSFIA